MQITCPAVLPSTAESFESWGLTHLDMIWDQAPKFSRHHMCYGIDTYRTHLHQLIREHAGERCARYLSLDMKGGRSHALTVFTTADGVCCVQIDGDERRRLGAPVEECCALTCYLKPDETVQSLFVVTREKFNFESWEAPLPGLFLLVSPSLVHHRFGAAAYYSFRPRLP